jgi:thiamine-phosphate pyrophosphorylase
METGPPCPPLLTSWRPVTAALHIEMSVKLPTSPFLYPILDTQFSTDVTGDAQKLIKAGVKILQLRAKAQTKRETYDVAILLTNLCLDAGVTLIINDHVDVALVTDASGVHLGQNDFPIQQARELLSKRIIGISTHTVEQYNVAQQSPVDYIAIGPLYRTTTKRTSDPALGIASVTSWLRKKSKPVVAIGGIRLENVGELLEAGVDGIAMISELYKTGNLYETALRCQDQIRRYEEI